MDIALIEAPSVLGLRPGGVERLPEALRAQGLVTRLPVVVETRLAVPPYDARRDPETGLLNPVALRDFSIDLADAVQGALERGLFSLVLGGDCSIVIGCLLGLRRVGRYGLFFMDGHADFYGPETSPTGEVADMDLAIVTGRGPSILTNLEGRRPLLRDEDGVAFGYRDVEEQLRHASADVAATRIHALPLAEIATAGLRPSVMDGLRHVVGTGSDGFWIHLDADVIDDRVMPAVDYRLPGGLGFEDVSRALALLLASRRAVGLSVAIFNPALDPDGGIAQAFVDALIEGFAER
jgi:arginase